MEALTKLSNEDLQALHKGNLAGVSDEGLKMLRGAHDEPGMVSSALSTVGKTLDYIPGVSRTIGQNVADAVTGGDKAGNFGDAAIAEAKPWGKYLEERGVPELGSVDVPLPNEIAKEHFNVDLPESVHVTGRGAIGAGMDIASDPVVIGSALAAPETMGLSLGAGGARAAQLLAKLGKVLKTATPVGATEAVLSGASKGTKLLGRTMAGLSKGEASEFVKDPQAIYTMAENISSPETLGAVQRTASEQLGPAIRNLDERAITPQMEKLKTLLANKALPVDTGKVMQMIGHGDSSLDEMAQSILTRDEPYGNMTTQATKVIPASELNALKQRGYQVSEYNNTRSTAQLPKAGNPELGALNGYLKNLVETASPEIQGTNSEVKRLITLRDRANSLAGNPLNPFSTESLDQMATLGELANAADAPELLKFRNQLKAARTVVGKDAAKNMSGGHLKHSVISSAARAGGRGLLRVEDAMPFSQMLSAISTSAPSKAAANLPPEIWAKLLEAQNGENK